MHALKLDRAMILAAGRGERMRPLTDHCPKPLLRAGGDSLIGHRIRRLRQAGFIDLVINHAHLGDQIVAALGTGAEYDVRISYSPETPGQALETGGGIFNALPLLGGQPFVVTNADIWCDFDYSRLSLAPGDLATLVLVDNPPHHFEGDFFLQNSRLLEEPDSNCAGIVGNIPVPDRPSRLTFSGIGCYHPDLFKDCQRGAFKLAPLLREAIRQGKVGGLHHQGQWFDIGTPDRLAELDALLQSDVRELR